MIVVMKSDRPSAEVERVSQELYRWDITPEKLEGRHKVVIGLVGDTTEIDPRQIQNLSDCIDQVIRVKKPFQRVSLEFRYGEPSEVIVPTPNGSVTFAQNHPLVVVAKPCTVENEEMIVETA